jgi:hypothetical protein
MKYLITLHTFTTKNRKKNILFCSNLFSLIVSLHLSTVGSQTLPHPHTMLLSQWEIKSYVAIRSKWYRKRERERVKQLQLNNNICVSQFTFPVLICEFSPFGVGSEGNYLESDIDAQLLLCLVFMKPMKLFALQLRAPTLGTHNTQHTTHNTHNEPDFFSLEFIIIDFH